MIHRFLVLLCLVLTSTGFADDIVDALKGLEGTTYREVLLEEDPKIPEGYRRFDLTIVQPVDHFSPAHGTFKQKLVLLHRDLSLPMVLHTSGYKIFSVKLSAIAKTFKTNQLQVEHRFFDQSTPAVLDWTKLDVRQSAYDFHRIVGTFKKIFRYRWVNTGASKGGMTSVFHRRFFPNDLDGTVADVAPLSFSTEDPRYPYFVDNVGGEKYRECREKLEALQVALLQRRSEMLEFVTGSFVLLGGKSVVFEHASIELPFAFWQYQSPEDAEVGCAKIPAADASAKDVMAYMKEVNDPSGFGDTDLLSFIPYFFQAATQLGSPASKLHHLNPYRKHAYSINQYTPPGAKIHYSNVAMYDVDRWVRSEAQKIMFVYGEFDPWTAGAFPKSKSALDFHWLMAPEANHGANFLALKSEEKEYATGVIGRWLDAKATPLSRAEAQDTLDRAEFEARAKLRIP